MANEKFKINGVVSEVVPTIGTTGDILKKTVSGVEWGALAKATQTEAESGTDDTKVMTPLRVKQAVGKLAPTPTKATQAEAEAGTDDTKLMTPLRVKQAVVKLAPVPNYPVTSVNDKTGAVTISKFDVGLGSVNNVAITAAQVTKINELSYTRAMTQAQYNALSTAEKNRTDVWYGIYRG